MVRPLPSISRGGLFVRTHETIGPGRRVLVEVALPGGESIEAIGRVAWTRDRPRDDGTDSGIGLQFVGAGADAITRLERFLRTRGDADASASARDEPAKTACAALEPISPLREDAGLDLWELANAMTVRIVTTARTQSP